jgi:epoxyqueuosine reductase
VTRDELTAQLKTEARTLGFDLVGVAAARPLDDAFLRTWIATGRAGPLAYMTERSDERLDPAKIVPNARSVIALAVNYWRGPDPLPSPDAFRVARYARGRDYHLYMRRMVRKLRKKLLALAPGAHAHPSVDTSPVLEKVWAEAAGLGWVGRNGLLITPTFGSWVLLATLITDVELAPDQPHPERCGDCRACLPACPTQALLGDGQVDARRCLSTWTIETDQAIPAPFLPAARGRHFGCDLCQEVCPWNRFAKPSTRADQAPMEIVQLRCSELLALTDAELRAKLVGSALQRPGLAGLRRDAALGLPPKVG